MPHRARDTALTPSLPGLTRQSILFEKRFLRRWMDTRVKPAYDAEYVAASCSNSSSYFQTTKLPHSRGAMRPRFADPSRTPRGGGAVGGARAPMGTLEAGLMDPPRAARHRARPRQGAAPPSAPPATRPSTVPGRPGPPAFALSAERIASRKRPLIGQDASRISEVWGTGIGIHSQVRERRFASFRAPDAASSPDEAKRNPGAASPAHETPDYAALHPGYAC
jgi:hypothetical protein